MHLEEQGIRKAIYPDNFFSENEDPVNLTSPQLEFIRLNH
jgi:hypothetical protein